MTLLSALYIYIYVCVYTGVHITGTQVRMGENNQQCVMPLVLLRAFAY